MRISCLAYGFFCPMRPGQKVTVAFKKKIISASICVNKPHLVSSCLLGRALQRRGSYTAADFRIIGTTHRLSAESQRLEANCGWIRWNTGTAATLDTISLSQLTSHIAAYPGATFFVEGFTRSGHLPLRIALSSGRGYSPNSMKLEKRCTHLKILD